VKYSEGIIRQEYYHAQCKCMNVAYTQSLISLDNSVEIQINDTKNIIMKMAAPRGGEE
jgi:hypothetical protein